MDRHTLCKVSKLFGYIQQKVAEKSLWGLNLAYWVRFLMECNFEILGGLFVVFVNETIVFCRYVFDAIWRDVCSMGWNVYSTGRNIHSTGWNIKLIEVKWHNLPRMRDFWQPACQKPFRWLKINCSGYGRHQFAGRWRGGLWTPRDWIRRSWRRVKVCQWRVSAPWPYRCW